jgi:hypothetical protein
MNSDPSAWVARRTVRLSAAPGENDGRRFFWHVIYENNSTGNGAAEAIFCSKTCVNYIGTNFATL